MYEDIGAASPSEVGVSLISTCLGEWDFWCVSRPFCEGEDFGAPVVRAVYPCSYCTGCGYYL